MAIAKYNVDAIVQKAAEYRIGYDTNDGMIHIYEDENCIAIVPPATSLDLARRIVAIHDSPKEVSVDPPLRRNRSKYW